MLKRFVNFYILSLVILSLGAYAHAQSDPNDPTSPNYKKSKEDIGDMGFRDRWSLSVLSQAGRSMEEFSEAYALYAATATYSLSEGSITLSANYSHPFDLDTDDARPWRFGDPSLTYNTPQLFKFKLLGQKFGVTSRLSYLLPVSETSQYASSYGTAIGRLNAVSSFGRFALILSPALYLSYHDFTTADEAGFLPNSPVGVRGTATIRAQVFKNFSATLSAYLHNYWDYETRFKQVQGLSSNLIYQVRSDLSVNAFASWRDRVITNNSLFDDDSVRTGLGVIYTF